jgi:hypothetical protein
MHDLIGCNKESCNRNNKKENQILDECKTIKTEHLFRCDQGDVLDDMRLQNKDGMHASDKHIKCDLCDKGLARVETYRDTLIEHIQVIKLINVIYLVKGLLKILP